ncbi:MULTISPECIES: hypothetical protein [Bacteroides]|uniref:Uncharacterized protein n=1 Tax=Bacteroides vicugnae TaxID=3037989 RepID=A0ABU5HPU9_9BACE|nr:MULTISPECIES: hypothetical protein [Bacteroides]MDC2392137.1 hypothetical protein [Bacteroides ovatus]MDC2479015.1 hypothetical protein [Bacteroides ovatus]MDY7253493.1 hypothetical protein [Bacteroides sp. A1-P5]MDY7258126.1 hypothetical protein [Bacteroides sp. A2-P53]
MNKSKLKWRVVWSLYCIPGVLLAIPILSFTYILMPFVWIAERMGRLKYYLIRKYKP